MSGEAIWSSRTRREAERSAPPATALSCPSISNESEYYTKKKKKKFLKVKKRNTN